MVRNSWGILAIIAAVLVLLLGIAARTGFDQRIVETLLRAIPGG